jgi:hypothetical protein
MRKLMKNLVVGSLLVVGAAACADLEVVNYNAPDASRSLASAGDVESLISGSFNTWFHGWAAYGGPAMFMSNAAFQHNAPWSNSGMELYGRLPRVALENDVAAQNYGNLTRVWYRSYRAIAALADGLKALEDPDIADELGAENVTRDKAFAKLVQGLAHGTVALLYDRGFIVDETTDLTAQQDPLEYSDLMTAALGYLDEAISIANGASFTVPAGWAAAEMSSAQLARVAHSWKARFMAQVARTPADRAAVNWSSVISEVNAGITATQMMDYDWGNGWYYGAVDYGVWPSWSQYSYWMYGMADQSGNYQEWLSLDLGSKSYQFSDGRNVLIVTPDTRFPRGATLEEQLASDWGQDEDGAYHHNYWQGEGYLAITPDTWAGNTWKKPERGVWRWSWYKNSFSNWLDYGWNANFDQPFITMAEMNLLKAEGMYRNGDMAGAAALVNETRTLHGLNATDAAGTNTSCVPKLPNGSCGDLLEMLKWEKRLEAQWTGIAGANWWFDGRGWGDMWKDTPLQFPIPCQELQVLQILPCNTYGGPGGEMGSAGSSYNFPFEG